MSQILHEIAILVILIILFMIFIKVTPMLDKLLETVVKWFTKDADQEIKESQIIFLTYYDKDKLIDEIDKIFKEIKGFKEFNESEIKNLVKILKKEKISKGEKLALKRIYASLGSINQYSHTSSTISLYTTFIGGFFLSAILNIVLKPLSLVWSIMIVGLLVLFLVLWFIKYIFALNQQIENDKRRIYMIRELLGIYINEFVQLKEEDGH